nr:hypothetical protein GCM10017611_23530 [Rhodococcus wratislaviensis]
MTFREHLASGIGVLRWAVDTGIAITSMMLAVPVAFVVGEATAMGRRASDLAPPNNISPDSTTHDLGTDVTLR